jgi:hypothetical protein
MQQFSCNFNIILNGEQIVTKIIVVVVIAESPGMKVPILANIWGLLSWNIGQDTRYPD